MSPGPGRIRGTGAGRKTRRSLQRGGTGAAGELNAQLGKWPRVRITPMFGRWGYFVGDQLFACFPLRTKDTDLWIRVEDDRHAALRRRTPQRLAHHAVQRTRAADCLFARP